MSQIIDLIYEYGIWAMFLLILMEYACFPVSSEIVLPFSGAFAASKHTSYLTILLLSIVAGLIGTSLCYVIGKAGGSVIIAKIEKKFPKSKKSFDICYEKFDRFGNFFVLISRVIPLCRTYVSFVAGAMELSYSTYFFASLAGISIWNALLIGLGYFLGNRWSLVIYYYGKYKNILFIVISISFLSFLIFKIRNKKSSLKA